MLLVIQFANGFMSIIYSSPSIQQRLQDTVCLFHRYPEHLSCQEDGPADVCFVYDKYAATSPATNVLYNSELKHRAAMRVTVKHDLLLKTALNTDKC